MKANIIRLAVFFAVLLLAACGAKDINRPGLEVVAADETEESDIHAEMLYSIMNDAALLAHIDDVIGAPLLFDEDAHWGLPFITVLPFHAGVIVVGHTDWTQLLTVYLRPDYSENESNWIFEAYNISGDGIVLVEPFNPRGAIQTISDDENFTMRIYYEGLGWSGDWYDFNFHERIIPSENWMEYAIRHIRDITGIAVRDMWLEGNVLYIQQSPIESYVAWGPALERTTFLLLTGASLPGVEYVLITGVDPGPFNWVWELREDGWGFEPTARKVLNGHRWAWVGPNAADEEDMVLGFFERQFGAEIRALGLSYRFAGLWDGFYQVFLMEFEFDDIGNFVQRVPRGQVLISEDFAEIIWMDEDDVEA